MKIKNPEGVIKPIKEAANDWNELAKPMIDLGFVLYGYDPGITFLTASGCPRTNLQFSVPDLMILNKALID